MNRLITFVLTILITGLMFESKAQVKDSVAVKLAVEKFLTAFNSLQWEPFRKSFAEDATIFFPDWEQGSRVSGRQEIEKTWLEIFPEFNDSTSTLKLGITPRDIKVQLYGQTAIVTFPLGTGDKYLSRRTLVMVKIKREWKIAHLHASTLLPEKE